MDLTEESMKGRRYRRRHLSMTVLLCIIIALLTAALLLAAYVISKLERNNLFSKSVFLGNNYFLGELSGESGESESQSQDSMTARVMSNLEKQLLAEAVFDAGDYPYGDDMVKAAEDAYYGMDNSVGSTDGYDENDKGYDGTNEDWDYIGDGYDSGSGKGYDGESSGNQSGSDGAPEGTYGSAAGGSYTEKFGDLDTESAGYDAYGNYYIPEFYNYLYIDAGSFKSSVATLLQAASDTFASLGYSDTTCRSVETLMLELSGREFLITDGLEKQLSVPYISQEGSFPNGCESVSAVMLLRYYGFDITPDEFIDSYLPCEPVRISWGTRYGPNPKLVYAGDPRSDSDGYGCFAPVIVKAMNSYLSGKGYYAKNVTGTSLSTLASTYIDSGNPVLVWGTVGMKEIDRIIQWQSDDRTESFLYPANEHCMVFSGYDGENYWFSDPYDSNGTVAYPISDSVMAYNQLGTQAVVIMKSDKQ